MIDLIFLGCCKAVFHGEVNRSELAGKDNLRIDLRNGLIVAAALSGLQFLFQQYLLDRIASIGLFANVLLSGAGFQSAHTKEISAGLGFDIIFQILVAFRMAGRKCFSLKGLKELGSFDQKAVSSSNVLVFFVREPVVIDFLVSHVKDRNGILDSNHGAKAHAFSHSRGCICGWG